MKALNMIVEIPKGSSNKYEYDIHKKQWILDRVLFGSMFYPEEYGFIPDTVDYDGDPLDVVCFVSYPTFPGCSIPARIVGVLRMIDQGEHDYKLIAVNDADPRFFHIKDLEDIGNAKLEEIANFFLRYKELEKKEVVIEGYGNKGEAIKILNECQSLLIECKPMIERGVDKKTIVKFLSSKRDTQ